MHYWEFFFLDSLLNATLKLALLIRQNTYIGPQTWFQILTLNSNFHSAQRDRLTISTFKK